MEKNVAQKNGRHIEYLGDWLKSPFRMAFFFDEKARMKCFTIYSIACRWIIRLIIL